jgi:hypothetical protein
METKHCVSVGPHGQGGSGNIGATDFQELAVGGKAIKERQNRRCHRGRALFSRHPWKAGGKSKGGVATPEPQAETIVAVDPAKALESGRRSQNFWSKTTARRWNIWMRKKRRSRRAGSGAVSSL